MKSVLVVCPTSLKYQWKKEIEKFTGRSTLLVEGLINKRKKLYQRDEFYKIISYGVTRNDRELINDAAPDLVILDEAQRIKNWQTKTAQAVKKIQSRFAIVLTGTPLENRLQEIHSIIEQLPGRIDKNFFVEMTEQQWDEHQAYYDIVRRLVNKWRTKGFLKEEERQKLLINLACMRMVSDSTYVLDQNERHDSKITELMQLLENVMETEDNKVVIFSEWKKMFELVIRELEKRGIDYVYLNGDLSTKERKRIINRYHDEKNLKVFLSTDAGGLGLNLQCANVIINLDLPWNPARLEQRIARVYRLGQNQHVYTYNFISKGSIEHRIFHLLKFKKSVFSGTLDGEEDTVKLDEKGFMDTVKNLTDIEPENGKSSSPEKDQTLDPIAEEKTKENEKKDPKEHINEKAPERGEESRVKEKNEQHSREQVREAQHGAKKETTFFNKIKMGVRKFLKKQGLLP